MTKYNIRLLPDFYQTDMTQLPPAKPGLLILARNYLQINPAHGVIIEANNTLTAIWNAGEDRTGPYYSSTLPLEDPGDANPHDTAWDAIQDAIS